MMSNGLFMSYTYIWGRSEGNIMLLLFGFFPVRAAYIVWVLQLVDVLQGVDFKEDLSGVILAHQYYFLKDVYPSLPLSNKKEILITPSFLRKIVDYFKLNELNYNNFNDPVL